MTEVMAFLVKHWALTGFFLVMLLAVIVYEIMEYKAGVNQLTPDKLTHKINRENALVLDIRPPEDFAKAHVVGSKQVNTDQLAEQAKKAAAKKRPVVIVDQDGRAAQKALADLSLAGYTEVFILAGGIVAWKEAGLPLENK